MQNFEKKIDGRWKRLTTSLSSKSSHDNTNTYVEQEGAPVAEVVKPGRIPGRCRSRYTLPPAHRHSQGDSTPPPLFCDSDTASGLYSFQRAGNVRLEGPNMGLEKNQYAIKWWKARNLKLYSINKVQVLNLIKSNLFMYVNAMSTPHFEFSSSVTSDNYL